MDDYRTQKIAQLKAKILRIKSFREELNDTNEDTLSLDQLVEQLEDEVKLLMLAQKELSKV